MPHTQKEDRHNRSGDTGEQIGEGSEMYENVSLLF